MNVLVYDGPGVSPTSLSHTLSSLKTLLLPHFAVQIVTASVLSSQPWTSTCALLVIPGGRDLPYVASLASSASTIGHYVASGGSFLGICAGAYYASRRVEWETGTKLEISGDRPLGFFDGICKGSVFPGFAYESESGARAVAVKDVNDDQAVQGMYHNGGGEFIGARAEEILAKYVVEGEGKDKVAAVRCRVGRGVAILWGTHPEFPLTKEPLVSALRKRDPLLSDADILLDEERRWKLLRKTLILLGLRLPSDDEDSNRSITSPFPQFLTSCIPSLPTRVLNLLAKHTTSTEPKVLQERNDTFIFHAASAAASILHEARNRPRDQGDVESPKDIVFFDGGELPPPEFTPKFSLAQYYAHLSSVSARAPHATKSYNSTEKWGPGQLVLYGEAVTSTQTMLDKNPTFLRALPPPLLSLATHQLSGRGRGGNSWVSPAGCLQFSLLLRPSLSVLPASRLVFLQYLFGLAVVESCRKLMPDSKDCIKLKWPNDVYAISNVTGEDGRIHEDKKKVGGILVTTNFSGGDVDVVIGCGLNVLNPLPTTSLAQLTHSKLTMEQTAATIMAVFEQMWETFLEAGGSFEPFRDLYLERWMHSDQLVTLTTVSPPVPVRIVGITEDYGLLRTLPERGYAGGESFIDLQPDGNSFDLMAGLIKSKT